MAAAREKKVKHQWKLDERAAFLERVGSGRLLEVGAGTGNDSLFFKEGGLDIIATDLSAEMVAHCRAKGLDAHQMDFLSLDFPPNSFDAVYAMLCLLHVRDDDLDRVLVKLRDVLRPGGLFYIGVYGGSDHDGPSPNDDHDPPRYFRFRKDDALLEAVRPHFDVVDFHTVPLTDPGTGRTRDDYFQSLTLRKP